MDNSLQFAENMKHLREQILKCTQSEIPGIIGFPRTTWNNYERGTSKPNIDDLVKIARIFGISEYDLLHTELAEEKPKLPAPDPAELSALLRKGDLKDASTLPRIPVKDAKKSAAAKKKEYNAVPFPQSVVHTSRMPSIITVNEMGIDNIIYVPVKAQAGYLIGYGDQEYIESLPSFRMPGLSNDTFRMFEVEGVSMSPTLTDKDRVIGQWVNSLEDIRENRIHIVVLKDGVCIKRVLNRIKERGKIYLKSDTLTNRSDYPIREVSAEDILEVWYVRMKVSGDLSEPSEVYSRLADLEINQHEILKALKIKAVRIAPATPPDL